MKPPQSKFPQTAPPELSAQENSHPPQVRIDRRAALRLRAGHPWVYRSDLDGAPALPRGGVVRVLDERNNFLGSALASSSSQIALRILGSESLADAQLPRLVAERVRTAIAYRHRLGIPEQSNAYRVVFSEADRLPGLIVDRYNDVLAFQVLTQGMDRKELRDVVLSTLQTEFHPAGIVERVEPRIRELEELPATSGGLVYGEKAETIIEMNGEDEHPALCFQYMASAGQKTGAFLDQRENHARLGSLAAGARVLDLYCYAGGFALHALRGEAREIVAVDTSARALELARRNMEVNAYPADAVRFVHGEAGEFLANGGDKFDIIVVDPPPLARSRADSHRAEHLYVELNALALRALNPGGFLMSFSCSSHFRGEDFLRAARMAEVRAKRRMRLLARLGPGPDHPVMLGHPEGEYLTGVLLRDLD